MPKSYVYRPKRQILLDLQRIKEAFRRTDLAKVEWLLEDLMIYLDQELTYRDQGNEKRRAKVRREAHEAAVKRFYDRYDVPNWNRYNVKEESD